MKRKNIVVILATVVLVLAIAIFLGLYFQKKEVIPSILFYDIPELEKTTIKNIITENFVSKADESTQDKSDRALPFEFKELAGDRSLVNFLNENPDVEFVIGRNSLSFFEASDFFREFTDKELIRLPSTFKEDIFTKKILAYPFLLDSYELCCDIAILKSKNLKSPQSLDEWTAFLRSCKDSTNFPFICSGANDEVLLYLITTIMNLNGEITTTDEFNSFIKDFGNRENIPSNLKEALDVLVDWRREGLIHPEWFRLVDLDVEVFMEFKNSAVSFLSLRQHRKIKNSTISDFTAYPVPIPKQMERKNLPATIFFVAEVRSTEDKTTESNELRDKILAYFVTNDGQTVLSKKTGLAPVNASASVGDIQASNARYWAASSKRVIPDFTKIIGNLAADEKRNLVRTIRLYIEANGVGF